MKFLVYIVFLFQMISVFSQQTEKANKTTLEETNKEEKLRAIKSKSKEAKDKATYNLGNTIYKSKKYNEAKDKYLSSIEAAKTKTEKHKAYHNLGNVYMQEKNYTKAIEAYKNALKNNSKDEQTRYNLALAKEMLKKNPPKNSSNKDKKNKNKDQQNKDQQNKDNKDQNKNNKENDKNKEKNNKDKKNQEKNKQQSNKKEDQKQQNKKPKGANKQRIDNILNAINKDEKRVQQKVNAQKGRTKTIETEKDW